MDEMRRQVLALWWLAYLDSADPVGVQAEIAERTATVWRQSGEPAGPSAQFWRQLVSAVDPVLGGASECSGAKPGARPVGELATADRNALALALSGHNVTEVAYLEQASLGDVRRRLRRGLQSCASLAAPLPEDI